MNYRGSGAFLVFIAAALLPYFADLTGFSGMVPVLVFSWIMGIYAISFSLLLSQLGLLSFGHALYFGLGAYATVHAIQAGISYPAALLISTSLGAFLGLLVSFIVRKAFSEIPFAFITLAMQLIVYSLFRKREFSWLSGGEQGLIIYTPQILRSEVTSLILLVAIAIVAMAMLVLPLLHGKRGMKGLKGFVVEIIVFTAFLYALWNWAYILAESSSATRALRNLHLLLIIVLTLVYIFVKRSTLSPIGTIWRAIRDNELRIAALGYNVFIYKALALAISGAIAALAGSLYVPYALNINPEKTLSPTVSVYALIYSILGGLGSPLGPLLGSLLVNTLEIFLSPYFGGYGPIVVGLVFIVVMITGSGGLWSLLSRVRIGVKAEEPST